MKARQLCFAVVWALAIVVVLSLMAPAGKAQTVSAMLTGTVTDATGAVVPKANVTMTNEASGDVRRTVSNNDGFFTFAAIPPGSYTVTVDVQGFNKWEAKQIALNSGDKRNLLGIVLTPGTTKETITVEANAERITPVDSGEKSTVITERLLQNVAIIGQNAAEFIKIMPGMAMTAGPVNRASFAAGDEATGAGTSGPVGSFAPNGLRSAALDITSDGAHVIDPGCNCGQAVNMNVEMTAEVKVLTSNFGADASKGPAVITAIGKSGGNAFHGEAYLYAQHSTMNANDWLNNRAGLGPDGKPVAARPETRYYYPGFNIGGPVIIPKTNFNKNRDKLFFFVGAEYYKQTVDNGIYKAAVPTAAMRAGDFSDSAYLSTLNGYAITGRPNYPGGLIPSTDIDHNGLAMMNTYPLPNVDPAANQGYNYIANPTRYSNMYQVRPRIDYSISDNTKLYVTYNRQRDDRQESLDTLWTGNGQSWASPTTPYPTPIVEKTVSDSVTANLTHIFSPTLTNETVFTYTFLNLPNSFADPTKVQRGSLGIDYQMLFNHGDNSKLIFPQLTGWGDGISNQLNSGFELDGVVYAKKIMPSLADNLSKVWGTHTLKFGFYWERTYNSQPGNSAVNGTAVFSNWGGGSTGNAYADMLTGHLTQYNEQNFNTVPQFRYMSVDFYGQDSWKVTRRLTLEYGLRVSHLGPWSDITGYGFAAWYPNQYSNNPADATALTGLDWHKRNSSVPLSGSETRFAFVNPRFGFAWDIFGNGKTVIRGGYGMYHYHDEQNVQNGAYSITQGSYNSSNISGTTFAALANATVSLVVPNGVQAVDPKDDQQPRTQSYSFTVSQRTPWNSVLEVAYVGNKADYLSNYNNAYGNVNYVGIGTLQSLYGWTGQSYSDAQVAAARPMQNYASVKIINHKMYSNYNSLQASWNKQTGHMVFMVNYTFSKALGIRGENGAPAGMDPLNLSNDYGTLPNNRTHIFNAAYVFTFPKLTGSNAFVRGLVNDWQISGMTQFQSGADIQAAMTSNFGYSAWIPAGTTFMGTTLASAVQTSAQVVLGTPDFTLMPLLTCDPRKGLASNQYVNGSCFTTPAIGTQGTYIMPVMQGPGFFNSDLSLFKSFTFGKSENKKLLFRVSGYNFLNHPVRTFLNNDPNLTYSLDQAGNLQAANSRFGYADSKTGHRLIQLMVKFSW
jgi:hypothetical protein